MVRACAVIAVAIVCACGGGGAGDDERIGSPGDETFRLEWGPMPVAPGVEDTACVTKRLTNPEAIRVGQIHNRLQATSHHFIVYKVEDQEERPEPYPCFPFADTLDPDKGAPLMITQKKEETLALPEGVAFTLEPNQMIRLELHYINGSDSDSVAQAAAEFLTVAEKEYRNEADFLFIGNVDIQIPPRSTARLGPTYFPLPDELTGVNFFGITGHTHQWGTDVQVETATGDTEVDTPVYDLPAFQWNEPATVVHDPPFQVPQGGGFRFTCDWNNLSDDTVTFGESTSEEMCFFWAYYYPSQGARVCFHSNRLGGPSGINLCCPGDSLCSLLKP